MAPHCVCPKTRIKRLPSLPVQNSSEPSMLPSACVQVFPALRKTKSSPGIASNTVSTGTRESAHPRMALCGAWLYFAKAFSISPEVLLAVWAPAANRSLPSFSIFNATSEGIRSSAAVRTPWTPRASSGAIMEGGTGRLLLSKSPWRGDAPRNSTEPVSNW